MEFSNIGLSEWLVSQCNAMGLKKPTPVQFACIPPALNGKDVVGCAQTGSGKTAAFALPILETLAKDPFGVYALILTPTRELALQISEQFGVLGKAIGLKMAVVVGGMDMIEQAAMLERKPHIVVATPGRLVDHMETSDLKFKKIKYLVLDEADRLLSEGNFTEQLAVVFSRVASKRQTLLFSATMNEALSELQRVAVSDAFFWEDSRMQEQVTVAQLDQKYVVMPAAVKDGYLVHLVNSHLGERADHCVLVFTNTCKQCELVAGMLGRVLPDVSTSRLHSRLPQRSRRAALGAFRAHRVRCLVATDVACRGLDIPKVSLVLNFDVPRVPSAYVHRAGRTARAGRPGKAITLVTQYDVSLLQAVEDAIKVKLTELKVEEKEVLPILTEVAVAKSAARIQMAEDNFDERSQINKRKDRLLAGKPTRKTKKKGLQVPKPAKQKTPKTRTTDIGEPSLSTADVPNSPHNRK